MTCTDAGTGHFLRVSRESYQWDEAIRHQKAYLTFVYCDLLLSDEKIT
jgi:hypothetical protein